MPELRFEVDLRDMQRLGKHVEERAKRRIANAVRVIANEANRMWLASIEAAHLWEVEKEEYSASLRVNILGPLEAEVVSNYRLAAEIERGRPAKDLKAVIPTAKKARVAAGGKHKGQKYLIIPFRHNVPDGTQKRGLAPKMPANVYAAAKQLSPSRLLTSGSVKPPTRRSATGWTVPQHSYSWGDRLDAGYAPKRKSTHKTDPYAGMVRFSTSAGKGKSSKYLTFRVMGEWSSGWVVAPRPGLNLVKGVQAHLQPILADAVKRAASAS